AEQPREDALLAERREDPGDVRALAAGLPARTLGAVNGAFDQAVQVEDHVDCKVEIDDENHSVWSTAAPCPVEATPPQYLMQVRAARYKRWGSKAMRVDDREDGMLSPSEE